ncbi:BRO1-domain-containing protein [Hymenopellis radicata]|nr:BRO1-domain-containing protein [Hymenopellis radicata]
MANLLTVPLKKTYVVDVKEPTRNYLEAHTDAHPEAFKADLNQWQQLRKDSVDVSVHVNAVEKLIKYHAQLLSILTKLPADIGLEISYAYVFPPNNLPVTLRNLGFERASVLFNLAALYSQVAAKEDRMDLEGIKRAISYYQYRMVDVSSGAVILPLSLDRLRRTTSYGRVAAAVQGDIQSLMVAVDTSLKRAERDNDLIYHKDVLAISTLAPIPHAAIAQLTTPVGLSDPRSHQKKNLMKDQISDKSKELRDTADAVLRDHNLPASLEALERPAGLPPSLLKKAEEVRMENGPTKIDSWFEDLRKQAKHVTNILDEAIDILDNEATEDEIARESGDLARPPSYKANLDLIQKEQHYRAIKWEENIMDLIISEADLEALVPSSTSSKRRTPEAAVTQRYARNLRVLLESLDTVHADRAQIVRRAESLAEADDIRPRILKAATKLESLEEMQPAMFENVLDEELAKYDKYCQLLADNTQEQEDILSSIEVGTLRPSTSICSSASINRPHQDLLPAAIRSGHIALDLHSTSVPNPVRAVVVVLEGAGSTHD